MGVALCGGVLALITLLMESSLCAVSAEEGCAEKGSASLSCGSVKVLFLESNHKNKYDNLAATNNTMDDLLTHYSRSLKKLPNKLKLKTVKYSARLKNVNKTVVPPEARGKKKKKKKKAKKVKKHSKKLKKMMPYITLASLKLAMILAVSYATAAFIIKKVVTLGLITVFITGFLSKLSSKGTEYKRHDNRPNSVKRYFKNYIVDNDLLDVRRNFRETHDAMTNINLIFSRMKKT